MKNGYYCDSCGCNIYDMSKCHKYRGMGRDSKHKAVIYICEDCMNKIDEDDNEEMKHIDMNDGEIF